MTVLNPLINSGKFFVGSRGLSMYIIVLSAKIDSFSFFFSSVYLLLLFLAYCTGQYWKEVIRRDVLILSPILREKDNSFSLSIM